MPRQVVGLAPDPDRLEVDVGDDGHAGVQAGIERLASPFRAAGLVHIGFDAEPIERLAGPPGDPRVLPLIPECQGEDRPAVDLAAVFRLELPEDVAGTQAAADAEDRSLGQRLAGQARDDALDSPGHWPAWPSPGAGRRASDSPDEVAASAVGSA